MGLLNVKNSRTEGSRVQTNQDILEHKNGANEETLDSRTEGSRVQINKDILKHKNGANEETLTLDLFLGKEAL